MDKVTDNSMDEGNKDETAASNFVLEFAYNTAMTSDEGEPQTFKEIMQSKNAALWKLSAIAEVNNFLYCKAWTPVKLTTVKKLGRKPISTKWVFKIKNEWTSEYHLKCRIVTLRYMQVPGVEFTEKFSPVANDTSTRVIIIIILYYLNEGWICEVFDVEAAFLEPYLDNEMYIKWPKGMVELGFSDRRRKRQHFCQIEAFNVWECRHHVEMATII